MPDGTPGFSKVLRFFSISKPLQALTVTSVTFLLLINMNIILIDDTMIRQTPFIVAE